VRTILHVADAIQTLASYSNQNITPATGQQDYPTESFEVRARHQKLIEHLSIARLNPDFMPLQMPQPGVNIECVSLVCRFDPATV